jgi:hypothetical protein
MNKLYLIILLLSMKIFAQDLPHIKNRELTFVLNNVTSINQSKHFKSEGFKVRIFTTSSLQPCAILYECRPLEQLYIAVSEPSDEEGAIMSVYKLPSFHKWELSSWHKQKDGRQGMQLIATSYDSDNNISKQQYLLTDLTHPSSTEVP